MSAEIDWATLREAAREAKSHSYSPYSKFPVGAAALVPYSSLRRMVDQGKTSREIARHFNVSRELVEYRMKISRLWEDYKIKVVSGSYSS
jgi:hypothetical protein